MKYMLAVYEDEANFPGGENGEAWRAILDKHTAFGADLAQAGVEFTGAGLHLSDTATTVRTNGNGQPDRPRRPPRRDTRALGGFYILDVPDLDAALKWAKRLPLSQHGAVEVRPTLAM